VIVTVLVEDEDDYEDGADGALAAATLSTRG
jgi:hypothetical protein